MHILLNCIAFTEERQYTFEKLLKNEDTKKQAAKNIIQFFTKTGTLSKKRDLPASPLHLKLPANESKLTLESKTLSLGQNF
jgi:hypothetical protein